MARGRPEIPKYLQKKVASQLLERQKRADVYEKGYTDLAKGSIAGSAYPVDIADMLVKPALTPPASIKAATMRPRGGGIPETVAPVQEPKLKGTYPYVARKMGIDPDSAESIAGSFFSLDPMAKAHAVAMGTKLVAGKLAGLGMGAAMFAGLKKVDDVADAAKPIFTSPGKTAASDISKETIPANKVKSQLEGRGVNKDEFEWTGFDDWIKTKKGEVSKVEIEEFFQQNQIQVREVVKSNKADMEEFRQLARDRTADELELVMSNDEGLYNNREQIQPLIEKYRSNELEFTEWDELNELFDKFGYDEGGYISNYYQGVYGNLSSSDIPGQTKFASKSWQLPGGENYRELLLIAPPKKVPYTKENVVPITADEYAKIEGAELTDESRSILEKSYIFKTPKGVTTQPKIIMDGYPGAVNVSKEAALKKVIDSQPEPNPRYTGGHFEENDVVAHIRFNERVDPDGNKVLFIEEIQSDWAHKGQSEGFKTPESEALRTRLENLKMRVNRISNEMQKIRRGPSYTISEDGDYMRLSNERRLLQNEYMDLEKKHKKSPANPIEPGPFVQDIHQWTNLALKRMVRWGSDNGFDSIGWVTGKQSADRYNVSKQISEVHYSGSDFTAVDHNGKAVIQQTGIRESDLAGLIGKEPAKKLMEQPKDSVYRSSQVRTLSGLDLDIGGDYHKLIYDDVLLAQGKKIGKKYGAKVEKGHADAEMARRGIKRGASENRWRITIGDKLDENSPVFETFKEAQEYLLKTDPNDVPGTVWKMKLTDKLKQASKDGMPYYVALPPLAIGAAAAEQRTDAQRLQSKSDAQAIMAN